MARKRKGTAGMSNGATLIVILVAAVAAVPARLWYILGILAAIAGMLWLIKRSFRPAQPHRYQLKKIIHAESRGQTSSLTENRPQSDASSVLSDTATGHSDFHTIRVSSSEQQFAIPKPRALSSKARWIGKDESVTIGGHVILGGMFYFTETSDHSSLQEPSLIDARLAIQAAPVDLTEKLTGYWPSYSTMSPAARRGYLQWLADGRRAAHVDIGYVFTFFYGLERRAVVDSVSDDAARAEMSDIVAEVKRLRTLYRDNSSFRGYASNLLSHIQLMNVDARMYLKPPTQSESNGYELPMELRVALGQIAADGHAMDADWALAWALSDPSIIRRTPVDRCPDQFEQMFKTEYTTLYPAGLVLTRNKTMLKIAYRSASARLSVADVAIGDLPDITATSATRNKLQAIVYQCALVLDPYSRYLARNPGGGDDLEGILQLPVVLWPAKAKAEITDLQLKVGDQQIVMTLAELAARFNSAGTLSRGKVLAMAKALEALNIGMEPDVLSGSRTPKNLETIVLFGASDSDGSLRTTADYDAALVTLDLASAVAAANGETSLEEMALVGRHIDSWDHLSVAHRKRLKAYLQIQMQQPPTLASLRKKLSPLAHDAKRTIASFLAHLAQADGEVSPQEVRLLERVYKTLDQDPQLLYGDLHGAAVRAPKRSHDGFSAAAGPLPSQALRSSEPGGGTSGFSLDMDKVAQLQRETAVVSALLADVFSDEFPEPPTPVDVIQDEINEATNTIQGLDQEHSSFLRLIVSRSEWSRQELEDLASDMELMLDGALEQINEMAFEAFDIPVSEGDDPIEINPDILKELAL